LDKYPEIKNVGDDPFRPGIVHRIDKEVSGLVVVAKTNDFFECLKKQFQKRTVKKGYVALVYGRVAKDEGTINFPIKRASSGHKMAAMPAVSRGEKNAAGKAAITEFAALKNFVNYALLKINIKTGRTHQIRAHMAAYGHPIVGDNLYGTAKTRKKNEKLGIDRIFLFADELAFDDLAGKRKEFKIAMPEELKDFLRKVK